ncbi:MAG: Clp protease N-terminal domain-containing protein [Planctomycetota bacterium]
MKSWLVVKLWYNPSMKPSSRHSGLTPAAQRTVARCRLLAMEYPESDSWVAHLVLTLLLDQSLASACLTRFGINREWLMSGRLGQEVAISAAKDLQSDDNLYPGDTCSAAMPLDALNDPLSFRLLLDRASEISRRGLGEGGVTSVHLLLAILETSDVVRAALEAEGATVQTICDQIQPANVVDERPLPVDEPIVFTDIRSTRLLAAEDVFPVTEAVASTLMAAGSSTWRALDANLNRGREALRVLEDFARFIVDDEQCSAELKSMRHEIVEAEVLLIRKAKHVGAGDLLSHRDTSGDVGTSITASGERQRNSIAALVMANCRRLQEALRSLEEFGKLACPQFAGIVKQLRYRSYVIEQQMLPRAKAEASAQQLSENARRLQAAHIYAVSYTHLTLPTTMQV